MNAFAGWWFRPLPVARIAVLRTVMYLFVLLDMWVVTPWVAPHGYVPGDLYKPVAIPRILHLPVPDVPLIRVLQVAIAAAALIGAAGRLPRLTGTVVALGYAEWMFVAMSYGKIDHDRFALLVALAVLPTVGPARWGDDRRTEAAGWALKSIQLAVVATYFLSAYAKIRWGGWGWPNSEIFYWAMSRRGTWAGDLLLHVPWALHLFQWVVILAETASPLLLVLRGRAQLAAVAFFLSFHLMTWLTISIHFLPHQVCLLAFVPVEVAVARWLRQRAERGGTAHAAVPPGIRSRLFATSR